MQFCISYFILHLSNFLCTLLLLFYTPRGTWSRAQPCVEQLQSHLEDSRPSDGRRSRSAVFHHTRWNHGRRKCSIVQQAVRLHSAGDTVSWTRYVLSSRCRKQGGGWAATFLARFACGVMHLSSQIWSSLLCWHHFHSLRSHTARCVCLTTVLQPLSFLKPCVRM